MSDKDFIPVIAQLARSSPGSWDRFLAAYRAHCNDVLTQTLSSPPESVLVAQGRAKHADELLRLFSTALATAEQMEKRK